MHRVASHAMPQEKESPQRGADDAQKDPYGQPLPLGGRVIGCSEDAEAAYVRHAAHPLPGALTEAEAAVAAETVLIAAEAQEAAEVAQALQEHMAALQEEEYALQRRSSQEDDSLQEYIQGASQRAAELHEYLQARQHSRDNPNAWVPLQHGRGCRIRDVARRAIDIAQLELIIHHVAARLQGGEVWYAFRTDRTTGRAKRSGRIESLDQVTLYVMKDIVIKPATKVDRQPVTIVPPGHFPLCRSSVGVPRSGVLATTTRSTREGAAWWSSWLHTNSRHCTSYHTGALQPLKHACCVRCFLFLGQVGGAGDALL